MASYSLNSTRSNGKPMENQGFSRELQPGMEEEMLTSPENSGTRTSEIAPLQLESHSNSDKSSKGLQDGLKIIITSSICFAISVTIALILTIYLAPPQVPQHAAVVSDSKLCASTGEKLLQRGGSAVDAAIAVVLCEGLVNPHHSGIGGGGFMVVRSSKGNTTHVIDFMDSAPAKITNAQDQPIGMSVGVPGMLRGLELAHTKFGKLRWMDVIMSVVELAYSPVNISSELDQLVTFSKYPQVSAYFRRVRQYMLKNEMNLTRLGWLLQSVAKEGADAFYNNTAEEIVKTVSDAGGVMTKEDLTKYKAVEREPVTSTFLNMAVQSVPAPGGGPLLLLFLNIMENLTVSGVAHWNSTQLYHCIVETMKFTYGHQSELGDLDVARQNVTTVLKSKKYASHLASQIDLSKTHADPNFYSAGKPFHTFQGTSQISVIDANDDLVSLTVSLNGPFGSGLVTESGIVLNSHMLNFDDGQTNQNNIPEPGKRPLVAMTPTIIFNPSKPCGRRFALGGANGDSLVSGLAEVIMNIFGQGMPLGDAIDSPRLNVRLLDEGDEIHYEEKFPSEVLRMLKEKDHQNFNETRSMNVVHAVAKINETVYGHADLRSGSEAIVY